MRCVTSVTLKPSVGGQAIFIQPRDDPRHFLDGDFFDRCRIRHIDGRDENRFDEVVRVRPYSFRSGSLVEAGLRSGMRD